MFQATADTTQAEDVLLELTYLDDFREPLEQCGERMMESFGRNFDAQGRPSPWQPLSKTTLMNRAARGYTGTAILQVTGRLRKSVTQRGGENIWRLSENTLVIGTSVLGATIHQFGTRRYHGPIVPVRAKALAFPIETPEGPDVALRSSVHVAAGTGEGRPFLVVQKEDVEAIAATFRAWANAQIQTIVSRR